MSATLIDTRRPIAAAADVVWLCETLLLLTASRKRAWSAERRMAREMRAEARALAYDPEEASYDYTWLVEQLERICEQIRQEETEIREEDDQRESALTAWERNR